MTDEPEIGDTRYNVKQQVQDHVDLENEYGEPIGPHLTKSVYHIAHLELTSTEQLTLYFLPFPTLEIIQAYFGQFYDGSNRAEFMQMLSLGWPETPSVKHYTFAGVQLGKVAIREVELLTL